MGTLRKAGVWLGLVEDDDDRDYVDDLEAFDDDYDERADRRGADRTSSDRGTERLRTADRPADDRSFDRSFGSVSSVDQDSTYERPATRLSDRSAVGSVRAVARVEQPMTEDNLALAPTPKITPVPAPVYEEEKPYRITTLHPTTYNDARTIGQHFRDNTPVIMNLTEMSDADARRLVDFAAGLIFGLRGSIDRVTNRVFLLSPANVSVTAEDQVKIAEGGFFNQS